MVAMSGSLFGNTRRVTQILWLAASVLFTFAVLHSLQLTPSPEWVSSKVTGVGGGGISRPSMKDFIQKSESLWVKTVKQRHELIQKDWGTMEKLPLYSAQTSETYFAYPYSIWDFTPASWTCPHEVERIGRMGDGGKWVCGMSRLEEVSKTRPCIIYSFGIQNESSFENELLERTGCKVWGYDFSVSSFGTNLEPAQADRAQFMRAGISGKTDTNNDPPFYSIADLMKMNGHDYIDVMKMDIEFAEYDALDALSEAFPAVAGKELPIGQLLIEIHLFNGRITSAEYLRWWERLEARGLRPAWTEPNLLAVTMNANGDKNPNMAEYTLVNAHDSRNALFGGAAIPAAER